MKYFIAALLTLLSISSFAQPADSARRYPFGKPPSTRPLYLQGVPILVNPVPLSDNNFKVVYTKWVRDYLAANGGTPDPLLDTMKGTDRNNTFSKAFTTITTVPGSTKIIEDNFAFTGNLSGHIPSPTANGSNAWSGVGGVYSANGTQVATTDASQDAYYTLQTGMNNTHDIEYRMVVQSVTGYQKIFTKNVDNNNFLYAELSGSATTLRTNIATVATLIKTVSNAWVPGDTFKIRTFLNSVKILKNSILLIDTVFNNTILNGSKVGFYTFNTANFKFSYVSVVDFSVGSSTVKTWGVNYASIPSDSAGQTPIGQFGYNANREIIRIPVPTGGTPAGTNTLVQINNSGAFGVVSNFTGNSSTNVVNADTLTTHKLRSDSIKINAGIKAGTGNATSLFSFGDSFTAGLNATVSDSAYNYRLGSALALPVTNFGVSSTHISDAVTSVFAQVNYPHTKLTTVMSGYNDLTADPSIRSNGITNKILEGYKTFFVNQNMKAPVNVSTTGTRTGFGGTNWDGVANAGYKTHTTIYSNVAGEHYDYSFTDSTICGFVTGNYTIKIDGVTVETRTSSGYNSFFFTGLSYAAHTLTITNTANAFCFIDFVSSFVPASSATPLILFQVPAANPNPTGSAFSNSVNTVLDSLYTVMVATGYPVYSAKPNTYYEHFGVSSDSIHPNNLGHYEIFKAGLESIQGRNLSAGTFDVRTDGNAYYSKNGISKKVLLATEFGLQNAISTNSTLNAPNTIAGSNKPLTFSNFSTVSIDTTLDVVTGIVNVHGALGTDGPSATMRLGSRDGTGDFIYYSVSSMNRIYSAVLASDVIRTDHSYRTAFLNNILGTGNGNINPSASVHIGGNLNGAAGHTSLKLQGGILVSTPEPGSIENDSSHLYYTDKFGGRWQLDQQSDALKAPLASPTFTTLVTTPGEVVMNATNNNIIHGGSTATSLGFIAGTSTTASAASGAYIVATGNTYSGGGGAGSVFIGSGAKSSPGSADNSIYLNSDSIHLTTTSTKDYVWTATGLIGVGKWALPTSVFSTSITTPKVIGSGTAPTATIGSSFTGTVAVVGTDLAGTVTVTMTSTNSSSATLAEVFTLSFNSGYASAPHVVFSPSSATTNPTGYFNDLYIKSKSTSNFVVAMAGSRTASGVAVTTFSWDYIVVQ